MSSRSGESPPPETQTGAQQQDPPSKGKGVNDSTNETSNKEASKSQLDALESNPKGVLDDHAGAVVEKSVENDKA